MKVFKIIFSLTFLSCYSWGQSDYTLYNLKGKVRTVDEVWFNYESNKWVQGDIINFNRQGNKLTQTSDRTEDNIYDFQGNLIETKDYNFGSLEYRTVLSIIQQSKSSRAYTIKGQRTSRFRQVFILMTQKRI